jgi:hypothetical protein
MWPAEGSVAPEAAALLAEEGVAWIATDEGVLARSHPGLLRRGELYQPHEFAVGGRVIRIAFRDRFLSDRIGFTYARMAADEAARDFLEHVRQAGAQAVDANAAVAIPIHAPGGALRGVVGIAYMGERTITVDTFALVRAASTLGVTTSLCWKLPAGLAKKRSKHRVSVVLNTSPLRVPQSVMVIT